MEFNKEKMYSSLLNELSFAASRSKPYLYGHNFEAEIKAAVNDGENLKSDAKILCPNEIETEMRRVN